jgi:hypothetical protein
MDGLTEAEYAALESLRQVREALAGGDLRVADWIAFKADLLRLEDQILVIPARREYMKQESERN